MYRFHIYRYVYDSWYDIQSSIYWERQGEASTPNSPASPFPPTPKDLPVIVPRVYNTLDSTYYTSYNVCAYYQI